VLNGISAGLISQAQVRELQNRGRNTEPVPGEYEAQDPQSLF